MGRANTYEENDNSNIASLRYLTLSLFRLNYELDGNE